MVAARFFFLLGTYAVGRFLLFFVAYRLGVAPGQAAAQAGMLLALLTLVTTLAAPLGGWAADRWGRQPLMTAGALLSIVGVLGLITAASAEFILLCGSVMALGSAAFAGANWALTTELAPPEEAARFMGLANFGTAGGAAAAGLLGPLVDWGNSLAGGPRLYLPVSRRGRGLPRRDPCSAPATRRACTHTELWKGAAMIEPRRSVDLPSWLATLYAPLTPCCKRSN